MLGQNPGPNGAVRDKVACLQRYSTANIDNGLRLRFQYLIVSVDRILLRPGGEATRPNIAQLSVWNLQLKKKLKKIAASVRF